MPRRSLEKFMAAHVTIIDAGPTSPIGPGLGRLPPGLKTPANLGSILQDLSARNARYRYPVVSRRLEWNALFMFQKSVHDVEQMPAQLGVRPWPAWKEVA